MLGDNDKLMEWELIARRYNIDIYRQDFLDLKNNNNVSEKLLNFLIQYLQEKSTIMSSEHLKRFGLRILFFTTYFYKKFISVIYSHHCFQYCKDINIFILLSIGRL